ncbi:MAG: RNA polymerase sigma factor [Endomicrobiales bacterium]
MMEIQDIPNELLIQASRGDMTACEEIYRAASGFVYNVALRVAGSREDAEEITQDVFLKIFKSLDDFRFQSSFKTWAYRITANTALSARKKAAPDAGRRAEYDEYRDSGDALHEDPVGRHGARKADEEQVNALLEALNPDQRMCVILREMQGLSYEEIARALDVNINTVRTRLKRARETLIRAARSGAGEAHQDRTATLIEQETSGGGGI